MKPQPENTLASPNDIAQVEKAFPTELKTGRSLEFSNLNLRGKLKFYLQRNTFYSVLHVYKSKIGT